MLHLILHFGIIAQLNGLKKSKKLLLACKLIEAEPYEVFKQKQERNQSEDNC